jgi:hypothetical protein
MGKNDTDPFKMYTELMDEINNDSGNMMIPGNNKSYQQRRFNENDEDSEVFMTSKEKIQEERKNDELLERNRNLVSGEIEESVIFKRYGKQREHKYTEQEMDAIIESCKRVIVHDYGEKDMYHISDEERLKHDQLADVALKLGGLKRIYRRVDQYIEAMRVVYQAWSILATSNYLHSRDEFFEGVATGHIVSNRIVQPKLKKIDSYNADKLIQYISDTTLDPKDLLPQEEDPYDQFYTNEEYEAEQARLLTPEEIEYLTTYNEEESEGIVVKDVKWKYIRHSSSDKDKKKLKKSERRIRNSITALVTKITNGNHYKQFGHTFGITEDIFKKITNKSVYDEVRFDGSWSNNDAAEIYDLAISEEIMCEYPNNERYMTNGDRELQGFYQTLEKHGLNTVEIRRRISGDTASYDVQKQKANKKENKRIESALVNRINNLSKNEKFKKLVVKAEKKLEKHRENENSN